MSEQLEKDKQKKGGFGADVYLWVQALVTALVAFVLVFTFVGRVIRVDGSSMDPTLHDNDLLILQSAGYSVQQGDIVVLTKKSFLRDPIVKRVIAIGGQTVNIDYGRGTVSVDGEILDEPYIKEAMSPSIYAEITSVSVPEGSIFVMGDNRNASTDSRDPRLGVVDERYVMGRALAVVFPIWDFRMVA